MSKSNTAEADVLKLIFQGVSIAGIADNAATPLTALWVALHTADPGETGTQSTNECTYGSYARQSVGRTSTGFSINGSIISPVANVNFATASSGTETATYFSVGVTSTGAGEILYSGSLTPTVSIATGVAPILTTATAISED